MVNPGVLRPNWYGNCAATYGLQSVTFQNITCRAPTLKHPLPNPGSNSTLTTRIDNSMFVFYDSFGGEYPIGNRIAIDGWAFEDLQGQAYTEAAGNMDVPAVGKMVWTKGQGGTAAPFYLPTHTQQVNVYVSKPAPAPAAAAAPEY
jgi:hypothetical protein